MGDLHAWTAIPPPANGVFREPTQAATMSLSSHPAAIDSWRPAEEATRVVIESIQPTAISEERRKAVIEYVQKLIRVYLGSEVCPFGSVPLKTYLPDGDIDLTAVGVQNIEDALANDVRSVLEMEEQNTYAEFEVKDVQYIHAEVKLVKCLVQNIVVDISFNQIGGMCTLCFLEQVDRLIGNDHLFKRSIILIKAWCYYESRILGAHHGLISTYALETLVLYIFHLYHASLDGPLAVLYKFLDYYSTFDWDNYCISLYGPVSLSSLPELVAKEPENEGGVLLLTKEFLRDCEESFSVSPRGFESKPRTFPRKHLNIVDPLKENNNLGRSVSRANFYRIRSAFTYGARKLGQILLLPLNRIGDEVNMFFTNTLERHGSGERPDVQDVLPNFAGSELISNNGMDSTASVLKAIDPDRELCGEINTIKLSGVDENSSVVESNGLLDGRCSVGDARYYATSSTQSREESKASLSAYEKSNSLPGKAYCAPHMFFHTENRPENRGPCQTTPANLATVQSLPVTKSLPFHEEARLTQPDSFESSPSSTTWLNSHRTLASSWKADPLEKPHTGDCSLAGSMENGTTGNSSMPKKLSDLSGDYELHFKSLLYAQWSQEYESGTVFLPSNNPSSYQYGNNHSWDPAPRHGVYSHMNANVVPPGLPFFPSRSYPMTQPLISSVYGIEDLPKPRGTGTYFPNTNYRSMYKERNLPGRGKNTAFANHLSRNSNNGRPETLQDNNFQEKSSHEPPERLQLLDTNGNNHGKEALLDIAHPTRPALKETYISAFMFPPEGRLEFGSFGPVPLRAANTESGKRPEPVSLQMPGSGEAVPASTMLGPSMSSIRERSIQAYQLKDDGDFPPLTGC